MKKILAAAAVGLLLAGSGAALAQHRGGMHMMMRANPEDRAAFADARIAAVKAGLKLTPDQEKLWPPVENAVRDFVKLRTDQATARAEARKNAGDDKAAVGPFVRLQQRAEAMTTAGAGLKRIADAAEPLYKTLDEGQKRRLHVLTRGVERFGSERFYERGFRNDRNRDSNRGDDEKGDRKSDRHPDSGRL